MHRNAVAALNISLFLFVSVLFFNSSMNLKYLWPIRLVNEERVVIDRRAMAVSWKVKTRMQAMTKMLPSSPRCLIKAIQRLHSFSPPQIKLTDN